MPTNFQEYVEQIEGLVCWHVTVGGFAAHSFSLEFGNQHKRRIPIPVNPNRGDIGEFEGDGSLLVACVWRLEQGELVLASSDSTDDKIALLIGRLKGDRIASIAVDGPACDLLIKFVGGYRLKIFSEYFGSNPSFEFNWQLRVREQRMVVGLGQTLITERKTV